MPCLNLGMLKGRYFSLKGSRKSKRLLNLTPHRLSSLKVQINNKLKLSNILSKELNTIDQDNSKQQSKLGKQALSLFQQLKDPSKEALVFGRLGLAHQSLGDPHQAIRYFNQALPLLRQTGEQTIEASILGKPRE